MRGEHIVNSGITVVNGYVFRFDTRLKRTGKLRYPEAFMSGGDRQKCLDEALRVEPKAIVHDAAIGRDHNEPGGSAGAVCLHYRRHGVR
ncbi:hypothetical protein GCM10007276_26900 [Agaricicola taiwanensis]|uniref:Uncharacterized protein n=1 Tax=Agaricicola taiwanensis TaxID=591372 RepID=A0A8J3DXM5_9RHOB|nr:hypothetical protein GCM10007276_26900 [Agaricicola taiwanensis]